MEEVVGLRGFGWAGLKGELWMNLAVLAVLGTCRRAVGTAKGRRKKNAMIVSGSDVDGELGDEAEVCS
jgi:hypothetical protein